MPPRLEFDFRLGRPAPAQRRRGEGPFRVLILGNFSEAGRAPRGRPIPLGERRPARVEAHTLDDLIGRFQPRIAAPLGPSASPVEIVFRRLDDFHPDEIHRSLGILGPLRDARRDLVNPVRYAAAAATVRAAMGELPASPPAALPGPTPERDEQTLDRLLGPKTLGSAPSGSASGPTPDLRSFLSGIVAPHVVPSIDERDRDRLLQVVDDAAAAFLRAVMESSGFRALERSWRGLAWLASGVETGEDLGLFLLDVTKREILDDVRGAREGLERSALFRLLIDEGAGVPGGEPWSVVVGLHAFGGSVPDLEALAALGTLASLAGGPFLAEALPELAGAPAFAEDTDRSRWTPPGGDLQAAWLALRRTPAGRSVGLLAPRFLLRLPYGPKADPCEAFPFEELEEGVRHEALAWGNPALAAARLLAESFLEKGWEMSPGDHLQIDDLPAYVYDRAGERALYPCAEAVLPERAADAMLRSGLMPLLSFRDRSSVRLARFQSIADPPAPLAGPWT